ncbi:MAG: hypothetical protein COB93_11915 [Sneathiella sp.]|nr:MAG: hypothetical protein COB93_11915 [Sneathiella sp.]
MISDKIPGRDLVFSPDIYEVCVIAFDRSILGRPVDALDPTVGPELSDFCPSLFNIAFLAPHVEHVGHKGGGR